MMTLKPLIFFGTEDFSLPSLKALIDEGWPIKAVVTKPDTRRGRGRVMSSPGAARMAIENKIPVLQPAKLGEIKHEIQQLEVSVGVLVSYGKIIPKDIIDLFSIGIINIHPSLLPQYRGPSPIEAAILNGDSETGVSLMKLTPAMDAGPVYVQQRVQLDGSETKIELYSRLSNLGAGMLIKHLGAITDEKMLPAPQYEAEATYTKLLSKADGVIDWQESAEIIERKIRAYAGYPKTRAELNFKEVIITKARVASNKDDGELVVECGQNSYLEIETLIGPSGKTMSGSDFKRGYAAA
jgi:methionyl-tRNA formyltransferase